MMALALVCRRWAGPTSLAERALRERFAHRPALLSATWRRSAAAYAAPGVPALPRLTGHGVPLVVETGNEAIARGAMAAGLRFFAGYPITPSSEVMETLIDELPAPSAAASCRPRTRSPRSAWWSAPASAACRR